MRTVRSQKFIINSALNDAVLHEIIQSALRHSTATLLASKGWHPKEIQEWLRHADFYTTMNIYTHLNQENLVERSERLTGILKNRMA